VKVQEFVRRKIMSDINQVMNNIKMELQNQFPNTKIILKSLNDLRTKEEFQHLSDSDFFDIVGETFKLNPDFFMKELYKKFRNKMGISIGAEKLKEMEKYITEKFCLLEDERIVYECKGNIDLTELSEQKESGKYKMVSRPVNISVRSGNLLFTNNGIIAQGKLKVSGGHSTNILSGLWPTLLTRRAWMGDTIQAKRRKDSFELSTIYGYHFPIKNRTKLVWGNLTHSITYEIKTDKRKCIIHIKTTDTSEKGEHMNKIIDTLRSDANEVLDVIKEAYETEIGKEKRSTILGTLKILRKWEGYTHLSDSDFLYIVKETYKLDPEFFMSSIYPKMKSWKFPSFLSIKGEVVELIENLSTEGANFE